MVHGSYLPLFQGELLFPAITLVALGTSLPDMLASRTVTRLEKYADGAMIHITGSIAVNVLMGVGMPWLVAAGYHFMRVCVDRFNVSPVFEVSPRIE